MNKQTKKQAHQDVRVIRFSGIDAERFGNDLEIRIPCGQRFEDRLFGDGFVLWAEKSGIPENVLIEADEAAREVIDNGMIMAYLKDHIVKETY